MTTIYIANIISTKVLSSRPSARLLESAVADAPLAPDDPTLTLDLHGKFAMAPSFFDELIRIVTKKSEPQTSGLLRIELINVPSEASSKFHAVCRSHRLSLEEATPGHWIIARP